MQALQSYHRFLPGTHCRAWAPAGDVATAAGPAHVLERHACVYAGRRFAHIVFEYRCQRVSLLVTDVEACRPLALRGQAVPHVTSVGRIDDMPVASFRTSRQIVFVAGDIAATRSGEAGRRGRGAALSRAGRRLVVSPRRRQVCDVPGGAANEDPRHLR